MSYQQSIKRILPGGRVDQGSNVYIQVRVYDNWGSSSNATVQVQSLIDVVYRDNMTAYYMDTLQSIPSTQCQEKLDMLKLYTSRHMVSSNSNRIC